MKAFVLDRLDAPTRVRDDLPEPTPGEYALLVRVIASSVNPVDAAIAAGMLGTLADYEFPVVLGRDFAGTVEQTGAGVTRYAPGDEVYGFVPHVNPAVHDGSWSELIVVPEDRFVARKPTRVTFEAAGAAPLAGVTALLCIDALKVAQGDVVLVVGATGGVGSIAVQLAAHAGATVIAPGLPHDYSYLQDLGVAEPVDRDGDVAQTLRARFGGVSAILDLVSRSRQEFNAHLAALRPGGRGVSPLGADGEQPGRSNVMAAPTPENLRRLGQLLCEENIRIPVQRTYKLEQAAQALQAIITAHKQGKLAISIT
jgi:NADPH:quinone reductase-like Zn-dependent oxidoreductase